MSILNRRTDELPVAVIDFETTGLSPRAGARVVEVAVARVDPGEKPRIVVDTLIDPQGPVYATSIHGITDDDVVGAPHFSEMADEIADALKGAVVASYNASFDLAFLSHEFTRAGALLPSVPFVCLMYLRPLLGIGPRCDLASACDELSLGAGLHQAADDAFAEACLWLAYRDAARDYGLVTFGDLARVKSYKFTESFSAIPLSISLPSTRGTAPKSRTNPAALEVPDPWPPRLILPLSHDGTSRTFASTHAPPNAKPPQVAPQSARRIYWHALIDVTEDLQTTPEEIGYLRSLRERYSLEAAEVRALHARLFAERLLDMARDDHFTLAEVERITELATALRSLGWCPGAPSEE